VRSGQACPVSGFPGWFPVGKYRNGLRSCGLQRPVGIDKKSLFR
jgi:hypothetical protein